MTNQFNTISLLLLVVTLFLASCQKSEIVQEISPVINLEKSDELEGDELGVYTAIFNKVHHGKVKIHLTKNGEQFNSMVNANFLEDPSVARISDGGDYFIGDVALQFDGKGYQSEALTLENTTDMVRRYMLGSSVKFKNVKDDQLVFEEEMYIPQELNLKNISSARIESTNLYRFDKNKFELELNADSKNENGLLIILSYNEEYYGMKMREFQDLSPTTMFRAMHLPEDKGRITIPASLFEGIPTNGIATLYVARGNAKVVQQDNKEYLVRAIAQEQIRVVLN